MKFGKQLKLQSVSEWQEYYMSYKRLKRVIKKLMVQLKEAEEREIKEIAEQQKAAAAAAAAAVANGDNAASAAAAAAAAKQASKTTNEHLARLAQDRDGRSPILQSFSPSLSSATPPDSIGALSRRSRFALAGRDEQSPITSSKGSPGMVGGDAYQEFFSVVDMDIDKVNRFFASKYEELLERYHALETNRERSNSGSQKRGGGSGTVSPRAQSAAAPSGLQGSIAAIAAWMSGRQQPEQPAQPPRNCQSDERSDLAEAESSPSYGTLDRIESGASDSKESDSLFEKESHTISTSAARQLEERLEQLLDLYRLALHLQVYSLINYEGLRKIMKKFDKNTGEEHSAAFVQRLDVQPFRDTTQVNQLIAQIEDLYTKLNCKRPNQDIWSSQGMLRGVKRDVDNPKDDDESDHQMNWLYVLFAFAVGCAILLLPILHDDPRAKSCAALLGTITVLWVTEAVPFFVAALCIPLFTVLLGILADPTGTPLTADKASKAAFGFMFNDTIMLIIGGFSISAAFSKCNFELRLAAVIQRHFGDSPKLFLLAFMMLGAFLSCWISNIAAPVLLTTLLLPIVRDFGSTSPYARSLLLGLAFSCNIGGMMSPISSPQNAIALGYLEQALPKQGISFSQWLLVSMPFCICLVLVAWAYLVFVFLGNESDVKEIPMIIFEKQPINRTQVGVIAVTAVTVVLWCTLSYTEGVFGEMGTIAVLPAVIFFGTGVLNKSDLLGFSWNLILLIGGGNVLGAAVNSSQLLHIISQSLTPYLSGHSAYTTTITVLLAVFFVTTFVSHTVGALILTPIIVDIAASTGEVQIVLMTATLMMSGAMSLPMSSFPNANSLLVDDDFGRPFLHPIDYLKHGSAISIACFAALATIGYGLAYLALDHDSGVLAPMKAAHHGF